jgi:alpha-L-rhamnosidase
LFHSGFLSKSWLPEETVVLQKPHYKPQKMRIANRYAFRYIKIEVVATSIRFGL